MKMTVLAALMALAFNAGATNNNPPNECGNHGNNCQTDPGGSTNNNEANGGNGYGGSGGNGTGVGVGVGVGIGEGGNGYGGTGGEGGRGGAGGNAVAVGGSGGAGGDANSAVIGSGNSSAHGGDAKANQSQGQSSKNDNVNVSGSKSIAQMASENTATLKNQNANQSSATGNTTVTNVGGDSTLVERNAPPVFLGALTPTSCGGGFNAGGSNRDGAAAFGLQWVGKECRIRMVGDRFHAMGMVDSACEIYKTTKGFRDAAKLNPKLRDLDCTVKPEPAAVVVPVAPELAPRIPRG